jgi:hypothetical protein
LRMNEFKGASCYITRVHTLINQLMKNRGLSEHKVVENRLRLLIDTFENVVCKIEKSKDLTELTIYELVGSLLAHEQRKKLKKKKSLEIAL